MSAPSYNFRPVGFEDEDSDDDGFYLGNLEDEKELATKPSSLMTRGLGMKCSTRATAPTTTLKCSKSVACKLKSRNSAKSFSPTAAATPIPGGRGGFGSPKPKPSDKRDKYRRSNINKSAESPAKALSLGDFQNAVVRGNEEAVRRYLDEGFEVDTALTTGWTPLMYAANGANEKLMKLLLDRGANPKFQKDMYYVLMAACGAAGYKETDVLKCVSLLLDSGAEVNVYDRYHMSPLMFAARVGHSQVIERLIKAGANVDKQDSRGWTSITWAVSKGHLSAVRTLLNAGADPRKKHCDGQTAIDIAVSDEMVELLGGTPAQKTMAPVVAMSTVSAKGDNSVIPKTSSIPSAASTGIDLSTQYGTTYGELELFLCGLDLSHLVPLFQSQHVEFSTFLRLTEEDLIKMGISQIGIRKKILDGILAVHKKDWEKSSLPSVQYNKTISCPVSIAMVANVSKHTKYITATIGFIQDQIKKHPRIVEDVQDGTGPKQMYQHLVDTQRNVNTLHSQLEAMKTQLEQILQRGNYEPPDLVKKKIKHKGSRLYFIGLTVAGVVVITVIWNRQTLLERIWTLFNR